MAGTVTSKKAFGERCNMPSQQELYPDAWQEGYEAGRRHERQNKADIEMQTLAFIEDGIVNGKSGIYPDWVYESRQAIRHAQEDVPWLADLLHALEWEGGTIYQALNAVSRMVAAEKEREKKRQ